MTLRKISFRNVSVGLISLAALTSGCVPVERYNASRMESRQFEEQAKSAAAEAKAKSAQADALQKQLDALMANGGQTVGLVGSLQQQLAAKQLEVDELNKRYAEAIAKVGAAGALPVAMTNELTALAAANPDLIEFDQNRGIVKFRSDVTFDLGDATLKPKAKEVLTKFAGILNSPAAASYELLVAGHTDSAPVSNPETIRKGHKNNWYLSSHRAISVGEVLVAEKVNAQRVGVVGYADQRPTSSNGTDTGRAANRRVEVLILPSQVRSTAAASSTPPAPKKAPGNKDSAAPSAPEAPAPMPEVVPSDNK